MAVSLCYLAPAHTIARKLVALLLGFDVYSPQSRSVPPFDLQEYYDLACLGSHSTGVMHVTLRTIRDVSQIVSLLLMADFHSATANTKEPPYEEGTNREGTQH